MIGGAAAFASLQWGCFLAVNSSCWASQYVMHFCKHCGKVELKLSCNCFDLVLAALTLYHAPFRDRHFNSVECKEVVCVSDQIERLCVGAYSTKPGMLLCRMQL